MHPKPGTFVLYTHNRLISISLWALLIWRSMVNLFILAFSQGNTYHFGISNKDKLICRLTKAWSIDLKTRVPALFIILYIRRRMRSGGRRMKYQEDQFHPNLELSKLNKFHIFKLFFFFNFNAKVSQYSKLNRFWENIIVSPTILTFKFIRIFVRQKDKEKRLLIR